MTVTFEGRVSSRSSNSASGPPGERVILELNPQRKEAILQLTGWPLLEPGSLNLEVVESVIDLLPESSAALTEDGSTVEYPDGWKHIPVLRQGYLYYHATAQAKGERRKHRSLGATGAKPGTRTRGIVCRPRHSHGTGGCRWRYRGGHSR